MNFAWDRLLWVAKLTEFLDSTCPGYVRLLKMTLYGLKQTPRVPYFSAWIWFSGKLHHCHFPTAVQKTGSDRVFELAVKPYCALVTTEGINNVENYIMHYCDQQVDVDVMIKGTNLHYAFKFLIAPFRTFHV